MTNIYMGTVMDEEGEWVDVYRLSRRKHTARKIRVCDRCHRRVLPGEDYWTDFSLAGGKPLVEMWHADNRLCQQLQCRNIGHVTGHAECEAAQRQRGR
jgi:hypothetical protein